MVMVLVAVVIFGSVLIYSAADISERNVPSNSSAMYPTHKTNSDIMGLLSQMFPFVILIVVLFIMLYLLTKVLA